MRSNLYGILHYNNAFPNLLDSLIYVSDNDFENLVKNMYYLKNVALCTEQDKIENFTINSYFPHHFHLYKLPERVFKFAVSKYMPQNSPFTDIINEVYFKMFEAGILENRINVSSLQYETTQSAQNKVFSLIELKEVFLVLVFGHMLALIVFVLELILNSKIEKYLFYFQRSASGVDK